MYMSREAGQREKLAPHPGPRDQSSPEPRADTAPTEPPRHPNHSDDS